MKVIGLIGGMSWESSLDYYKIINQTVRTELGGQHSAKILMYSVDFDEIERLQHEDRWDETVNILIDAGRRVENGGADFILLCTNTMHKVADELKEALNIPLVHIVDAAAEEIGRSGISVVGLLGTRFTMEQDFYKNRLSSQHGLQVIIPGEQSRTAVHTIIYDELCQGRIMEQSRSRLVQIITELESDGAQGVILGCTELPMLIGPDDLRLPLFDTTGIHARKAVALALGGGPLS